MIIKPSLLPCKDKSHIDKNKHQFEPIKINRKQNASMILNFLFVFQNFDYLARIYTNNPTIYSCTHDSNRSTQHNREAKQNGGPSMCKRARGEKGWHEKIDHIGKLNKSTPVKQTMKIKRKIIIIAFNPGIE